MDNGQIRQQVELWIQAVTGLVPSTPEVLADIFWDHRPMGYHGDVYALCQLSNPSKIGQDAVRYKDNPTPSSGQEIIPVATGNRKITLRVTFRSFVNTDAEDALYYASLLDNSLSLPEHQETLRAAGLGYETTLQSPTNIPQMVTFGGPQEREMSGSIVAFRFHGCHQIEGSPTTYISQWGINETISDTTGDKLSVDNFGLLPP
jgi:hypothetical protein